MAELENKNNYLRARKRDAELTINIINAVDLELKKLGMTSRCSDTDSIKLEIKDKWLIEVEFDCGNQRGYGQIRMWKNAAIKRNTTTIVAYRPNIESEVFNKVEVYSCFWTNESSLPIVREGIYFIEDIAKNFVVKTIRYINEKERHVR